MRYSSQTPDTTFYVHFSLFLSFLSHPKFSDLLICHMYKEHSTSNSRLLVSSIYLSIFSPSLQYPQTQSPCDATSRTFSVLTYLALLTVFLCRRQRNHEAICLGELFEVVLPLDNCLKLSPKPGAQGRMFSDFLLILVLCSSCVCVFIYMIYVVCVYIGLFILQ